MLTIYDVFSQRPLPVADAIMNVAPGLDLVPANPQAACTASGDPAEATKPGANIGHQSEAHRKNRRSLHDLIVADTNPAASILNGSMLVAADLVNVICATNPLSFHLQDVAESCATIRGMEREFKRELDVKIVPNLYDNRRGHQRQEVLGELRSQFPGELHQGRGQPLRGPQ